MARTVPTELIVVNADTRRPVIDIDPLTVPTAGTWWVRSDAPGLVPFVAAAQLFATDAGTPVDIVWSGNVDRSFESACDCHDFARLIDMGTDVPRGRLTCDTCR